ncbi:hypothetical protein M9458_033344, partial [Cirrhinus mrigala]
RLPPFKNVSGHQLEHRPANHPKRHVTPEETHHAALRPLGQGSQCPYNCHDA